MQLHENSVTAIRSVVIIHDAPQECLNFFKIYSNRKPKFDHLGGFSIRTEQGDIEVWKPETAQAAFGEDPLFLPSPEGYFGAVVFEVLSIEIIKEITRKHDIQSRIIKDRIIIPSSVAFGIVFVFEQRSFA